MDDFKLYFGIGWEHIMSLSALDHLLFIAALVAIYLINDWKQVLILVTAFTIGHSLTLALSVYNIIKIQDKWVEFLIPCTIIITALSNLFQKNFTPIPIAIGTIRINYFLALFFGLIHGLGFANTIRFMLADDQNLGVGLFGFNLGLELGQIVVVTVLLLFAYVIINLLKIARRDWVIFLSAAVFSLALKIALERIP
jgi:HupE / UreJ protein